MDRLSRSSIRYIRSCKISWSLYLLCTGVGILLLCIILSLKAPTRSAFDTTTTRPSRSARATTGSPSSVASTVLASRASRCRSNTWMRKTSPPSRAADRESPPTMPPKSTASTPRIRTLQQRTNCGLHPYDGCFSLFCYPAYNWMVYLPAEIHHANPALW
ncbi:hypothetical protein CEXT_396831 [Caerostris extrusa]|uniref:Uncharacterized protein n=1 Tax=Caerostris extrusa TaxID=172846 RepID=A0AAV4VN64_CAEEX|nr:hypothetical protein CEXT_396831 [Caerostris extrusa]